MNSEVIEFGELIQTRLYSKHNLEWPEDTGMISKRQLIKQKLFMYFMTCILANSSVKLILIKSLGPESPVFKTIPLNIGKIYQDLRNKPFPYLGSFCLTENNVLLQFKDSVPCKEYLSHMPRIQTIQKKGKE